MFTCIFLQVEINHISSHNDYAFICVLGVDANSTGLQVKNSLFLLGFRKVDNLFKVMTKSQ
jgi:hypothetical protein